MARAELGEVSWDRMRLQDMLDVGLIDASWCDRLPPVLAARLREVHANPDG